MSLPTNFVLAKSQMCSTVYQPNSLSVLFRRYTNAKHSFDYAWYSDYFISPRAVPPFFCCCCHLVFVEEYHQTKRPRSTPSNGIAGRDWTILLFPSLGRSGSVLISPENFRTTQSGKWGLSRSWKKSFMEDYIQLGNSSSVQLVYENIRKTIIRKN